MSRTFSKKIQTKAAVLTRLIDDPEYAGQSWTWDTIGEVLELNLREAREVIYFLRNNATGFAWTVGTRLSHWETMPTTSVREALGGLINQKRHKITRAQTELHQWTVLAKVDPDPPMARAARHEAKRLTRALEDEVEALGFFLEIRDEASSTL